MQKLKKWGIPVLVSICICIGFFLIQRIFLLTKANTDTRFLFEAIYLCSVFYSYLGYKAMKIHYSFLTGSQTIATIIISPIIGVVISLACLFLLDIPIELLYRFFINDVPSVITDNHNYDLYLFYIFISGAIGLKLYFLISKLKLDE